MPAFFVRNTLNRLVPFLFVCFALAQGPEPIQIKPVAETEPVSKDSDDPAIWVHPTDPERSIIIGTDKDQDGGLYVYNLDGKTVQHVSGLARPNNVDVEYGFKLGGRTIDIAVATERLKRRLKVYEINRETGQLTDVSGDTEVFKGEEGEGGAPMGISLYRHESGTVDAIVSPKTGPLDGYLGQFRLTANEAGKVDVKPIRRFGRFSGSGEIEAIVVDDSANRVIYGDEDFGIRIYAANPDTPDANRELAVIGLTGYAGDREGLAVYPHTDGSGWIISSNQLEEGQTEFKVYDRKAPHTLRAVFKGGADATDGLDVTNAALGRKFPAGFLVAMNSRGKNFMIYKWEDLGRALAKVSN
jgi:3-phytase